MNKTWFYEICKSFYSHFWSWCCTSGYANTREGTNFSLNAIAGRQSCDNKASFQIPQEAQPQQTLI